MPMYEYGCLACNTHFDRLRRMGQDDADVTCPRCGGQVQRRLSVFAAPARGGAPEVAEPSRGGGGCGAGCCGGGCPSRN